MLKNTRTELKFQFNETISILDLLVLVLTTAENIAHLNQAIRSTHAKTAQKKIIKVSNFHRHSAITSSQRNVQIIAKPRR
jgi:hypothetical protein